jgi:hypothetical protein
LIGIQETAFLQVSSISSLVLSGSLACLYMSCHGVF